MHRSALLAGKIPACPNTLSRLNNELLEAIRDFLDDPRGYLAAIRFDALPSNQRRSRLRLGLAVGLFVYAVVFAAMLVAWTTGRGSGDLSQETQLIKVSWIPPFLPPPISQVTDPKPAHGGGGGGDNTAYPSAGQLPQWRLEPPVVAPTPETPINAPSLAVLETLLADPRFQPKRDDLTPTGLPDGVPGPPAAGPGSGRGLGSGNGGGAGPGKGPGIGEGEDGNFGGDTYGIGRPPNGRSSSQPAVDSRPVLLNNPRPLYTEEARVRKVQGVVKVRLLVGADGSVKEVVVKSGLPNGLTEQAIRAAYQMRFTPAIRGGVPVSYWLANVVIEFNIR